MLSLQVLFPNEFLPALDLLDRKLVTRFQIGIEEPAPTTAESTTVAHDATTSSPDMQLQDTQMQDNEPPTEPHANPQPPTTQIPPIPPSKDTVHYVRSAQQRSSRFSTSHDSTITYEVRLLAWNCTCPAFAFAAFPAVHPELAVPVYTHHHTSVQLDADEADCL